MLSEGEDAQHLRAVQNTRRITVSAEVYNATDESETFQPTMHQKSPADSSALYKILEPHYLFKHLEDRELENLVGCMEPKSYSPGAVISEDDQGNALFHVVMDGTVEIQKMDGLLLLTALLVSLWPRPLHSGASTLFSDRGCPLPPIPPTRGPLRRQGLGIRGWRRE